MPDGSSVISVLVGRWPHFEHRSRSLTASSGTAPPSWSANILAGIRARCPQVQRVSIHHPTHSPRRFIWGDGGGLDDPGQGPLLAPMGQPHRMPPEPRQRGRQRLFRTWMTHGSARPVRASGGPGLWASLARACARDCCDMVGHQFSSLIIHHFQD